MKNNKAADTIDPTSEHLKHGGHTRVRFLTEMLNYIIKTKKVAVVLKVGLVTPIFKKEMQHYQETTEEQPNTGDTKSPGAYPEL